MRASQVERPYERLAQSLAEGVGDWAVEPPAQVVDPLPPGFVPLDAVLWRLQRSARAQLGVDVQRSLLDGVEALPGELLAVRAAVLAWVDRVACLTSAAERRHRAESGAGAVKLAEVQAAIETAIRRGDRPFDAVPPAAAAWVAGPATEWIVHAIVLLANGYSLWTEPGPPPPRLTRLRRRAVGALRLVPRGLAFVLSRFARATGALAVALERRGIAAGGHDLQDRRGGARGEPTLAGFATALEWLRRERHRLAAGIELVAAAVEVAEAHPRVPDQTRARLARDLVLLVLDDVGLDVRRPGVGAAASTVVEVAVEAVRPYLLAQSLQITRGTAS